MQSTETTVINNYNDWNAVSNNRPMIDSDNVLLNIETFDTSRTNKNHKSAFELWTGNLPSNIIDPKSSKLLFQHQISNGSSYFKRHDVSEVLRGAYQRLAFDIDVDSDKLTYEDFKLTIEQLVDIYTKFGIDLKSVCGVMECANTNPFEEYPDYNIVTEFSKPFNTEHMHHLKRESMKKPFSAHIFAHGYFFDRTELFELFSQGKHHWIRTPLTNDSKRYLSPYIDVSVFKRRGKQQQFRFALSGKLIQNRPCPDYTDEQFNDIAINNFEYFVVTKCSCDTKFISESSVEFNQVKQYLEPFSRKSFVSEAKHNTKKLSTKAKSKITKQLPNLIQDDIDSLDLIKYFKSHTSTSHIEWIADLITKIKIEIKRNPRVTDNDLFDKFIQEEYQYYSHSNQRKLRQDYSVHWAIEKARSSPKISTTQVMKYMHNELAKFHTEIPVNTVDNCLKYTVDRFKSLVSHGVTYIDLMELIYFTFIFFTNKSPEFNFNKHIIFLDEEEQLQIKSYDDFLDDCKTDPITIKLCRYREVEPVKSKSNQEQPEPEQELYIESISIKQALLMFDCFKQKYYQWAIYSYEPNVFSLYSNSIKPTPVKELSQELPQPVSEILDLICSVLNDDANGLIVNYEEKNFILDWFAYILQHPESRNKTGLCIVTEQGIGKNLITNTICHYLTKYFSNCNITIDQIIGQYTIDLDRKLLAVINEVDRSKKDSDRLKSVITDEMIYINKKFGLDRNAKNACSYVFFSNHFDTKIISNGDRRFTLIRSIAKPKSKEWYNKIAENQMFKKPIADQFINHLLSRDLSKYSPDSCPDFAKTELFKIRNDATSVIQRIMVEILTKCDIEYLKFTDIVTDLNTAVVNGSTSCSPSYKTLYNKYSEKLPVKPTVENKPVENKPIENIADADVDITDDGEELEHPELATLIDLEHELVDEYGSNKKNKITNRLVNNVINFEDDKDLYKTTYKRTYTVIKLKSSFHKQESVETPVVELTHEVEIKPAVEVKPTVEVKQVKTKSVKSRSTKSKSKSVKTKSTDSEAEPVKCEKPVIKQLAGDGKTESEDYC